MAKPRCPDYGQQFLLPPALEDWVSKDHPVRFVREFVEQLDLAQLGFVVPDGSQGRPPYAAGLLLKIWLYGYLHRIRSSRRLEVACREHLGLVWLTGMMVPDHNSLWRFWRENKKGIRALFKHSVQLALEQGLVGLSLQALDGTKIQALCSGRTGWSAAQMRQLLELLERELSEAEQEIEGAAAAEPRAEYRLPESLQDKLALRAAVKSGLQALQETQRQHYHRQEPQAQRMQCDGRNRFGYNAQVVVDHQHGIAVASEVTPNENDVGQLVPLVNQARQMTAQGASPLTVADSGYGSGADIAQAAEQGLKVLVYPQDGGSSYQNRYHAKHFVYEAQSDTVRCPQGQSLTFERRRQKDGQRVRVYRCHCADCPVRAQCTGDERGREITVWAHTLWVQAMRQRLEQPSQREQLRQRGRIVERFFGHIKQHEGFRRWTVRGLEAVRAQWALLCCVSNLRVLYGQWRLARA